MSLPHPLCLWPSTSSSRTLSVRLHLGLTPPGASEHPPCNCTVPGRPRAGRVILTVTSRQRLHLCGWRRCLLRGWHEHWMMRPSGTAWPNSQLNARPLRPPLRVPGSSHPPVSADPAARSSSPLTKRSRLSGLAFRSRAAQRGGAGVVTSLHRCAVWGSEGAMSRLPEVTQPVRRGAQFQTQGVPNPHPRSPRLNCG